MSAQNRRRGKLTPKQRLEMIERVILRGEKVVDVVKDYDISRVVFYRFLNRYEEAGRPRKAKLAALADKKPGAKIHPRRATPRQRRAVLRTVLRYPRLSAHDIAAKVGIIGSHGVQRILERRGLNLEDGRRRFRYQLFLTRPWRLFFLFAEEFLLIAAPILLLYLSYLLVKTALFGKALTFKLLLGTLSAEIALLAGTFFFIYSLKYYLSVALVLASSLRVGDSLNGNGGGLNGFLNATPATPAASAGGRGRFNGLINGLNGRNGRLNGIFNGRFNRLFNNRRNNHLPARGWSAFGGNGLNGLNGANGNNMEKIKLAEKPFVSIHLPFYNEKRVAGRILEACTKLKYPNFEVLVLDDSNDGTTEIVREWAKKDKRIRLVHRPNREGWKGGALRYALKKMDPRAEFVVVLDADFIPFPDTLTWFLRYFYLLGANGDNNRNNNHGLNHLNNFPAQGWSASGRNHINLRAGKGWVEKVKKSKIAAVQGYQWHVLNKDENWITRGIRGEYSGSYIIERSGTELFGSLKQIAGSVYMIRADVLKEFGWRTSITEDFQLTLRLYEKGYKVIYTPYIQAPAECVSTLKRLIRQRMRWAEGHTHNIRKMFLRLWRSPYMTWTEKMEVLYLTPYYFQSVFFLVGTIAWILSEVVFRMSLPFWTATWGWSLVFTNMFSLLLMNTIGLFIEESDNKDYLGLLSFIALTYIIAPFQAYAAIKGLLEREEGHWFRTPKTGRITIEIVRGHFARVVRWLLPRRAAARPAVARAGVADLNPRPSLREMNFAIPFGERELKFATTRLNLTLSFRRRRFRWVSKAALAVLLISTVSLLNLTQKVPFVFAAQSENYYLVTDTDDVVDCPVDAASCEDMERTEGDGPAATTVFFDGGPDIYYWYSEALPTGAGDASVDAGSWSLEWHGGVTGDCDAKGASVKVDIDVSHVLASDGSGVTSIVTKNNLQLCDLTYPYTFALGDGALQGPWTDGNERRLRLRIAYDSHKNVTDAYLKYDYTHASDADSHVITPTMTIPENLVFFVVAAPLIPMVVLWLRRRRRLALQGGDRL